MRISDWSSDVCSSDLEGNLWHCTVPQLPFRGIPGMNAFNRWFGQFAVRRAMRAIGLAECISWFVVPHPGFLANRLGESLSVYYCIDDYRSEEHTSELQSLMRISYAGFRLNKTTTA